MSMPRGKTDFERQFEDCLGRLNLDTRIAEIRQSLEQAVCRGDDVEQDRLERELFRLKSTGR